MNDKEVAELLKTRCVMRCKFRFYPTQTIQTQVSDTEVNEKVIEGISLCSTCGASEDLTFE